MRHTTGNSQYEVMSRLRLPLIVLVTYAHSYSAVSQGYNLLTCGWDTLEMLKLIISQTLAKVAVPVFYVMSGYLFFIRIEQFSQSVYWQKIRRRASRLLVPYLIWNLLMAWKLHDFSFRIFWNYWTEAGQQTDWLGHIQTMTAPADMPLWFLRDLMVGSLLSPLVYLAIRKLGKWLIIMLTILYLSGVNAFIPGLSAYALYFFTLGAWAGINKWNLLDKALQVRRAAYLLSAVLAVAMVLSYHTAAFSSLMLAFRLASVPAVICLGWSVYGHVKAPSMIETDMTRAAYFLYLAHYVVFLSPIDHGLFQLLGHNEAALCIHYLAAPLLKGAILVGVYCLWHQFLRRGLCKQCKRWTKI